MECIFKKLKLTIMALQNTTTIDLTNPTTALNQYNDLMATDKIVMVILGDSPSVAAGIQLADNLARQITTNETLWVMAVGNHTVLKTQLEQILNEANIIQDDTPYEEIKAFCLSKAPRKADSRIHLNGSLDPIRLTQLYREAIANS